MKIALKITGYTFAALFVAAVIGYNFIMRPGFLQPIIIEQFAKNTNGKLEIKIEQTSLFRGFKFSNIVVHPPKGYKETPVFKAREVNLLYNVFGFFRGKFGVHEIALKDAFVFIEQKNNITNAEALAKPSEKKEPEKEKPKEEPAATESSPVISWFFDIQIFARFMLENFNFTFDALDTRNKERRFAELKDFTFNFAILTRDFHRIDTSDVAGLVGLLNALVIELNPQKAIQLTHKGLPASIDTRLDLFWRLFYDGNSKTPEFISRMHFGQDKIPVSLGGGATQNLSFLLHHKIDYNPKQDKLNIEDFYVKFLGDTLLALSGTGKKLLAESREIEIQTGASRVNLGKVFEVVSTLTRKRDPAYSGFFSIKPTKITVKGNTIDDAGGIKLERVFVRAGALGISLPIFELDHAAFVDQALKPIPVKHANVKMRAVLNGSPMGLDLNLADDKKTAVNFYLRGFDISPFAAGQALGQISTTFTAAGDSPQNLAINLRVFSPQLNYFLDRAKSGINRIDFNVKGTVKSSEDFTQNSIHLPVIYFSDKDKDYGSGIDLKSRVTVEKGGTMKIGYSLDALTMSFKELLNTLPTSLQEDIGGNLEKIGKTMRADGETAVAIVGTETAVNHTTHIAFPDIAVDDIQIRAKVRLQPATTYLDHFSINGLRQALSVTADGTVTNGFDFEEDPKTKKKRRVPAAVPNIRYKVELAKKEETEILTQMFLVGSFTLAGTAKGNIVNGQMKIDDLSFRNPQVRVTKINMDFPFKHDLKLKKTLNLRAGNKERIIKNYNFNRAYNFTIQKIEIPDPNIKGELLAIIYPRGNYPAIGASMEYKDNVFIMPVMQMYMLNGVITISDTLFNLGRLKPSEMEYSSTIQIKDIDLKQLMVKEKADSITDGKLRIDMLFTGNRLDKPIENLNGYLSVYYIGPEFAKMVMRAANPKQANFISTLASNAATPKRIDIDLKDGFVYNNIPMNVGIVGSLAFAPKEVKNDRINIPEFFQRISEEANVYRAPAANTGN